MRVGIVGTGKIVREFLEATLEVNEVEVISICARRENHPNAIEYSKKYGVRKIYANYDEFLLDSDIDTVYVALPNSLHYEYSLKALKSKKDVICEKPFTSTLEEAVNLECIAKENERFIVEAVTTLYLPSYLSLREKIKEIGKIKIIQCNYSQYSSRYDSFKKGEIPYVFDPKLSGGALYDINVYNINFVVSLFGKPKEAIYNANIERGIDTSGILYLDYENFKCICIGAKDSQSPSFASIQGENGCIYVNGSVGSFDSYEIITNNGSKEIFDFKHNTHRMVYELKFFERLFSERDNESYKILINQSKNVIEIIDKSK